MASPRQLRKPACRVKGCGEEVPDKVYYIRHRVCAYHANKPALVQDGGRLVRWCQQCATFQPLGEFEGCRKTCRRQLAAHNRRRRKRPSEAQQEEAGQPRKAQRPQQGQGRRSAEGSVVEAGGDGSDSQARKGQCPNSQDLLPAGLSTQGLGIPPLAAKQGGSPSAANASSQPGQAKLVAAAVVAVAAAVAAKQRAAHAGAPGEQPQPHAPPASLPLQQQQQQQLSWFLNFTSGRQQPPPGPFAAAAGALPSMTLPRTSWLQHSIPHGGAPAWEAPHAAPAVPADPAVALLARLLALLVARHAGSDSGGSIASSTPDSWQPLTPEGSGHLPTLSVHSMAEQSGQEPGQGWPVPSPAAHTTAAAGAGGSSPLRAALIAALGNALARGQEQTTEPLHPLLHALGQVGSSALHTFPALPVPPAAATLPAYPAYSTLPLGHPPPSWAKSLKDLVPSFPSFSVGQSPYSSSFVPPAPSLPQPPLASWGVAGWPAQPLCPTIAH